MIYESTAEVNVWGQGEVYVYSCVGSGSNLDTLQGQSPTQIRAIDMIGDFARRQKNRILIRSQPAGDFCSDTRKLNIGRLEIIQTMLQEEGIDAALAA